MAGIQIHKMRAVLDRRLERLEQDLAVQKEGVSKEALEQALDTFTDEELALVARGTPAEQQCPEERALMERLNAKCAALALESRKRRSRF